MANDRSQYDMGSMSLCYTRRRFAKRILCLYQRWPYVVVTGSGRTGQMETRSLDNTSARDIPVIITDIAISAIIFWYVVPYLV
jgi:hypothetical protein